MGWFSGNNKKSEEKNTESKNSGSNGVSLSGEDLSRVLIKPRITEKGTMGHEKKVYLFDVSKDATKSLIKKAVKTIYKVDALKVRIVNTPSRRARNSRTGRYSLHPGTRKAYIYLKKEDSISVM